jgi:uncharacterized membrane protein
MNPDNGLLGFTLFGTILIPILASCIGLLLLYGVVRVAVARGLRDHQLWMEKHRPGLADQHTPGMPPRH